MQRTHWTWFAFGLVLGIILGGSAVGTYFAVQLHEAREEVDGAREREVMSRREAREAEADYWQVAKERDEYRAQARQALQALHDVTAKLQRP